MARVGRPAVVTGVTGVAVVVALVLAAGCGGGPDASVGVVRFDDTVEVRAKACGDGGIERIDVVDPAAPDPPVWSASALDSGSGTGSGSADRRHTVPIASAVPGYRVEDRRPGGALPDRQLRVLVEGPDGESWGGPRFTPSALEEGILRVAGQDVPLEEWESEPARCGSVGLAGALAGGLATAVIAGALWLVVRALARVVRRPDT